MADHHFDRRIPSTAFGVTAFSADVSRHMNTARRICMAVVALVVLFAPFMITLGVVWLIKPSGELSADSNTGFWIVSSIAVAIAALSGVWLVVFEMKHAMKSIYLDVYRSIETSEPEMAAEFERRIASYTRTSEDEYKADKDVA